MPAFMKSSLGVGDALDHPAEESLLCANRLKCGVNNHRDGRHSGRRCKGKVRHYSIKQKVTDKYEEAKWDMTTFHVEYLSFLVSATFKG